MRPGGRRPDLPVPPLTNLPQPAYLRLFDFLEFLRLSLAGKKLKGEWTLQRNRDKGPNAWVLEKAGESMKPLTAKQEDQSVLTKRTMAQIAADQDAVWQSNRA